MRRFYCDENNDEGRTLLLLFCPDITSGFVRLERFILNGWIVFWSIDEIFVPGGKICDSVGWISLSSP